MNTSKNSNIKLNVKYYNQVDNNSNLFGAGSRQCNLTSNAMLLNFLLAKAGKETLDDRAKKQGYSEGESVYGSMLYKFGDTTDHAANTAALKEYGIESYFSYTLSLAKAITSLRAGIPVVCGVEYKVSGHIILMVGYDANRDVFLIHDPYGSRAGSEDWYAAIGGDAGKYDEYQRNTLEKIWGGSEQGWGRIVTRNQGKPTGLPLTW